MDIKRPEQAHENRTPVRVLHVLGRLDMGGAETMLMNIYRHIDRTKLQFDFMIHTTDKCDYSDEIIDLGGKIYSIDRYSGKNHFSYKNRWKAFFETNPEYRIIHGHMRSTASIYLGIAKNYGLRTIVHSHSVSSGYGIESLIKNLLQYRIRYVADYFFACSKAAGVWLFGEKVCKSTNFFIVNNSIDAKKFIYDRAVELRKRRELDIEGKFVIGHVGRFHGSKNHDFIIDVFKSVQEINPNVSLLLVGEGSTKERIENRVADLKLQDSVVFTGKRSDIHELLQAMDLFVFPSLYEGLGLGLIEAQAVGLPCIVSDCIPDEAVISSSVEALSLDNKERWIERIIYHIKSQKAYKYNAYEVIKNSGFDIRESTNWLEDFYLKQGVR
ncbi:glycosyltransferase family 1 protein [Paenibacillus senegalensis]|uniref:glycosyltransferase family 1 protein n=1 Tax=Paenibacillus senegalensis TaxID=1465766 RepID=UPI000289CE0A|nr:glycosyltransferase family 1 protein [Paenibacillus senegalensis]